MSKKLLLADDSITIQKVIGITFVNQDFQLTVVDNGDAALEKAHEIHPDLVLADVFMPGRNGYELCAAIKKDPALARVPVLLLAGTFEPFDEDKARAVGADSWIAKPFESQALIDRVEELLERAAQFSETAPAPAEPAFSDEPEELKADLWEEIGAPQEAETDLEWEDVSAPGEPAGEAAGEFFGDVTFEEEDLLETEAADAGAPAGEEEDPGPEAAPEEEFTFEEEPLKPEEDKDEFFFEEEATEVVEETRVASPPGSDFVSEAAPEEEFVFEDESLGGEEEPEPESAAEEDSWLESGEENFFFDEGSLEEEPPAEEEEILDLSEEDIIEETPQIGEGMIGEPKETASAADLLEGEEVPVLLKESIAFEEALEPAAEEERFELGADWGVVEESQPAPPEEPPVATVAAFSPAAAVEERFGSLSEEELSALVERVAGTVIERLAGTILERIAWEVVPDLAESLIREEIRNIKDGVQ